MGKEDHRTLAHTGLCLCGGPWGSPGPGNLIPLAGAASPFTLSPLGPPAPWRHARQRSWSPALASHRDHVSRLGREWAP